MKNIYGRACVGLIAVVSIAHAEPETVETVTKDPILYFKNNSKHVVRLTLLDSNRQKLTLHYRLAQFTVEPHESLSNSQFSIEQIGGMLIEYCRKEWEGCFCPLTDANCALMQQQPGSGHEVHEIKFKKGSSDREKIYLKFEITGKSPRVKPQEGRDGKTKDKRFGIKNNIKEKDISVIETTIGSQR